MQLDVFMSLAIVIVVLFAYSELKGKKILGVLASLISLLLGVFVISDPIANKVGERTTGTFTEQRTTQKNITSGNFVKSSVNVVDSPANYSYTVVSDPSVSPLPFSGLIGLILVALSIFGLLHYGMAVGRDLNE